MRLGWAEVCSAARKLSEIRLCGAILFSLLAALPAIGQTDGAQRGVHGLLSAEDAENRGLTALGRLPDGRVLVFAPAGIPGAEPIEPAKKISQYLTRKAPQTLVVSFYGDVEESTALQALSQAGVRLYENPDLIGSHYLVRATPDQLVALSRRDEVARLFPASADLATGRPVYGCKGANDGGLLSHFVATQGMGWDGFGQQAAYLTYSIGELTEQLPADVIEEQIGKALTEWQRHADIHFNRIEEKNAEHDVRIRFVRGNHGDGYKFDGKGKVLAHTFYPTSPEPIAGDLHLDDDDTWSDPDVLYSVLLHELGHSLGLAHADRPGAVMYPYYSLQTELQGDDIDALLRLYAPPPAPPEETLSEEPEPESAPEVPTLNSVISVNP